MRGEQDVSAHLAFAAGIVVGVLAVILYAASKARW